MIDHVNEFLTLTEKSKYFSKIFQSNFIFPFQNNTSNITFIFFLFIYLFDIIINFYFGSAV